jgi:hypothetical protein
MYRRLEIADAELDRIGLTQNTAYRDLLEGLAGSSEIGPVRVLADVTTPGDLGLRHRVNPNYRQDTPLNRFVDTARPDSAVARHFESAVDRYLSNRGDTAARDEIRRSLTLWAANDAQLRPSIEQRAILRDAGPVSAMLSDIANRALAAMNGATANKSAADLAAAQKPIGEVRLAVATAIAKLIAAVSR